MAWQIGCNIANMPDPQAKKLVKGIKLMAMLKKKKSQFLEKINGEFPNSIQDGNLFMTTIVHGIIAR
jgi:hypothetical protein